MISVFSDAAGGESFAEISFSKNLTYLSLLLSPFSGL